jgi:hypothetical protein
MTHQKPSFVNSISAGNILTAIGIIITGSIALLSVWMGTTAQIARAETAIREIDKRVDRMEDQIERRLDRISTDVRQIRDIIIADRRNGSPVAERDR